MRFVLYNFDHNPRQTYDFWPYLVWYKSNKIRFSIFLICRVNVRYTVINELHLLNGKLKNRWFSIEHVKYRIVRDSIGIKRSRYSYLWGKQYCLRCLFDKWCRQKPFISLDFFSDCEIACRAEIYFRFVIFETRVSVEFVCLQFLI